MNIAKPRLPKPNEWFHGNEIETVVDIVASNEICPEQKITVPCGTRGKIWIVDQSNYRMNDVIFKGFENFSFKIKQDQVKLVS